MADAEQSPAAAVVSAIGVIVNFFVFAGEVPLMRRLVKEGSAAKYSFWPATSLLLATSLWSNYTIYVRPTVQLYMANFSGFAAALIYLTIFAIFSAGSQRLKILALTLVAGASGLVFFGVVFRMVPFTEAGHICGTTTVVINGFFYIAPLRQLYPAVKQLDTTRVPVTLSFMQFIGAVVWGVTGVLLNDLFIIVPNLFGAVLSGFQLGVLGYITWQVRRYSRGHTKLEDGTPAGKGDAVTTTVESRSSNWSSGIPTSPFTTDFAQKIVESNVADSETGMRVVDKLRNGGVTVTSVVVRDADPANVW